MVKIQHTYFNKENDGSDFGSCKHHNNNNENKYAFAGTLQRRVYIYIILMRYHFVDIIGTIRRAKDRR